MIQPLCARAPFGVWRVLFPFLWLSTFACNQRASDVREWRPTDHNHTENPSGDQVQVDPQNTAAQSVPGLEEVTLVAWQQNCTPCHGQIGRGDGPRGPMLKATDLTNPVWQRSVTDEQMAAVIKVGRGAMPAFKLPDATIANLVKLVRMLNAERLQAHGEAAPSAAASASASPKAIGSAARPPKSTPAPTPSAKPSAN